MAIFSTMLLIGLMFGFIGGGGSGFVLAALITLFGMPVHTALGTSMVAMVFTVLSGSISHMREGNVEMKTGLVVGLFGALASFGGTFVAELIPAHAIVWMSASLLLLSGFLIWLRTRFGALSRPKDEEEVQQIQRTFWFRAAAVGLVTGFLSGTFGIGSTPFIQLGLMMILGLPIRQAVATTMMIILPIAFFGGVGYIRAGFVDFQILLLVVAGTMAGSYIGAKFTKRAPMPLLRAGVIAFPIIGGMLMLAS